MDYATPIILGLVGSIHCGGMCGSLALALPQFGKRTTFILGRLAYNFGRVVTYVLIGTFFGAFGQTLALAGFQRYLSIGLGVLILAGLVFSKKFGFERQVSSFVSRVKSYISVLLRRRSLGSQIILGFFNGFLPCGLVYVAAAAATATGSTFRAAAFMAAFGIGTIPLILAIGLSGSLVPFSVRLRLGKLIPVFALFLGTLLIFRGLGLGIPFLSPELSANPDCCHH